ncbi:hypothetical protein LNO20_20610 [Klebsiella quasipneumoniae subsp. quasipneumoniae]|nr:hypothetical protein [Klebsiella quasipneumoniae subsp. quasipneumoniae]
MTVLWPAFRLLRLLCFVGKYSASRPALLFEITIQLTRKLNNGFPDDGEDIYQFAINRLNLINFIFKIIFPQAFSGPFLFL